MLLEEASSPTVDSLLDRVASGEWVVLRREGRDMAALVSMDDLRLLEWLIEDEEDRQDVADANVALAEGGPTIPLAQLWAELEQ